ncbi:RNAse P Rpr2/Rpp21/SNM1 subunit domain-containing protein [Rhizophagus clarus]|uniref:RNAse P Rpr2/Rpp21/SNM1 subunit domain-containing protein n=1 Tax=Rhizophagus clarus TaxID=94130 RepID=A0A8H3MCP5_9GLOM|nr:RNAse P Rpr2/Rpp21/SNM1 subunit domain-containing protein [Rhizophagus clarus]
MTSQDASNRLQFLWDASHTFLSTVPSLSAFYMQQFNQFSAEKELKLSEAVKRKYCNYCGNIFLPVGQPKESNLIKQEKNSQEKKEKRQVIYIYSSSHNNDPKKQTHTKRRHKNHVSYVCNSCNRETRFSGSVMEDTIKQNSDGKQQKEYSSSPTTSVSQDFTLYKTSSSSTLDKFSNCKKTKKKQKKKQLQQLLAEEKRKSSGKRNDFNNSSDGLSLKNFLSEL